MSAPKIIKDAFTHIHPVRVRWAECDPQSIVFNVNYFLYYDLAMTEWMRALNMAFSGAGAVEFMTVRAESNFRAPAVFDDELEIGARCFWVGHKSMVMALAIYRGKQLLNDGLMTYVHVNAGTKNSSPLPDALIDRIVEFEKTTPLRADIK